MPAKLVPAVRTTYTLNQLIGGLIEGWYKKFGVIPKKESIGVLYAQNALETGGTVAMWNNNIGNVKFVPSQNPDDDNGKEYMMLPNTWEIINGKKVTFQPPHPATWFRSFPTLGDGVAHHLDFLKSRRYAKSWAAVEAGDPAEFAHLLKVAGYYTAPEADYIKLMNFHFKKFMASNTYETVVATLTVPVVVNPEPQPEATPELPSPPPPEPAPPSPEPAPPSPEPAPINHQSGETSGDWSAPPPSAKNWFKILFDALFPLVGLIQQFIAKFIKKN